MAASINDLLCLIPSLIFINFTRMHKLLIFCYAGWIMLLDLRKPDTIAQA